MEKNNENNDKQSVSRAVAHEIENPDLVFATAFAYPPPLFVTADPKDSLVEVKKEKHENKPESEQPSSEAEQTQLKAETTDTGIKTNITTKKQEEPEEEVKESPNLELIFAAEAPEAPNGDGEDESGAAGDAAGAAGGGDGNPIQKKEGDSAAAIGGTDSNGMPAEVRGKMESTIGHDFSNVNIHANSTKASDVNALAYTQGTDIHFAPGQFNTNSKSGQELLGHELTHVKQQAEGRVKPTTQASNGMAVNDDRGLEKEADDLGAKAATSQAPVQQNKSSSFGTKEGVSNSILQKYASPKSNQSQPIQGFFPLILLGAALLGGAAGIGIGAYEFSQTDTHRNRNSQNRFPTGILRRKSDGSTGDYTYVEGGNNVYVDEDGMEWRLLSDDKNVFHQPDDAPSGSAPNKKFLAFDDQMRSFEAILQPNNDGTYTDNWLNDGNKQGTYNYHDPDVAPIRHGLYDVLPHFFEDDYTSTPTGVSQQRSEDSQSNNAVQNNDFHGQSPIQKTESSEADANDEGTLETLRNIISQIREMYNAISGIMYPEENPAVSERQTSENEQELDLPDIQIPERGGGTAGNPGGNSQEENEGQANGNTTPLVQPDNLVDYYMQANWDRQQYDEKTMEYFVSPDGVGSVIDQILPPMSPGIRTAANIGYGFLTGLTDVAWMVAITHIPIIGIPGAIIYPIRDIVNAVGDIPEVESSWADEVMVGLEVVRGIADIGNNIFGNLEGLASFLEIIGVGAGGAVGGAAGGTVGTAAGPAGTAAGGTGGAATGAATGGGVFALSQGAIVGIQLGLQGIIAASDLGIMIAGTYAADAARNDGDLAAAAKLGNIMSGHAIKLAVDLLGMAITVGSEIFSLGVLPSGILRKSTSESIEQVSKFLGGIGADKLAENSLNTYSQLFSSAGQWWNDFQITGGGGDVTTGSDPFISPAETNGSGDAGPMLSAERNETIEDFQSSWTNVRGENPLWYLALQNTLLHPEDPSVGSWINKMFMPSGWIEISLRLSSSLGSGFINDFFEGTGGGIERAAVLLENVAEPALNWLLQFIAENTDIEVTLDQMTEMAEEQRFRLDGLRSAVEQLDQFVTSVEAIANLSDEIDGFSQDILSGLDSYYLRAEDLDIPDIVPDSVVNALLQPWNDLVDLFKEKIKQFAETLKEKNKGIVGNISKRIHIEIEYFNAIIAEGGAVENMILEAQEHLSQVIVQFLEMASAFASGEVVVDFSGLVAWLRDVSEAAKRGSEDVRLSEFIEWVRLNVPPYIQGWKDRHEDEVELLFYPNMPPNEVNAVNQARSLLIDRVNQGIAANPNNAALYEELRQRINQHADAAIAFVGTQGQDNIEGFWTEVNLLAEISVPVPDTIEVPHPTPDPSPDPSLDPSPDPVYHTVVRRDNLWNLARQYYGDPWLYEKIWHANEDQIDDPHWIYPGQVLLIPDINENTPSQTSSNDVPVQNKLDENKNIVQASNVDPIQEYSSSSAGDLDHLQKEDTSIQLKNESTPTESSENKTLQLKGESIVPEGVNVHTESSKASEMDALAFAQGTDIHFAPGQFKPETRAGQELIGHELGHVVQQKEGRVKPTVQKKGQNVNDDVELEKEADDFGKTFADSLQGKSPPPIQNKINRGFSLESNPLQQKEIEVTKTSASEKPDDTLQQKVESSQGSLDPLQLSAADPIQLRRRRGQRLANPSAALTTIRSMMVPAFKAAIAAGNWDTGLSSDEIDEVNKINELLTDEAAAACADMRVLLLDTVAFGNSEIKRNFRFYVRGFHNYYFASEGEMIKTPGLVRALEIGEAIYKLIAAFPDYILKNALIGSTFNAIDVGGYIDNLCEYYRRARPIFQSKKDFAHYYELVATDNKNPLDYHTGEMRRQVRSYHKFTGITLDNVLANYADQSKSKPLTLYLHSGVDHNGAFSRDPNNEAATGNANVLTLLVEGQGTLAGLESQVKKLAKRYGQNGKIAQAIIAGHGNARSMELTGDIREADDGTIEQTNDTTWGGNRMDLSLDSRRGRHFMDTLISNMEAPTAAEALNGPHGRIVFNACLTNSHDVDDAVQNGDIAGTAAAVNQYITDHPNLVEYTRNRASELGNANMQVSGANASTKEGLTLMGADGGLDYDASTYTGDDASVLGTKLEYVEKGRESTGLRRALLEEYARDKVACIGAMDRRIAAAGASNFEFLVIETYKIIKANFNNNLLGISWLMTYVDRMTERGGVKLEEKATVNSLETTWRPFFGDAVMVKTFRAFDRAPGLNYRSIKLIIGQVWADIRASKITWLTNQIGAGDCKYNIKYLDLAYISAQGLDTAIYAGGGGSAGKTTLALIMLHSDNGNVDAKTYLQGRLNASTDFPAALNVPTKIAGFWNIADVYTIVRPAVPAPAAPGPPVASPKLETAQTKPSNSQTPLKSKEALIPNDVNVTTESSTAVDMGALAFAQGNNIHFAPGQFKPDTRQGQELIGHELAHVVQQKEGRVKPTAQAKGTAINNDSKLEKEADDFGITYANSLQNKTPSPLQNKFDSGFSLDNPIQKKLPKNIENSTSLPNFQLSSDLVQKKEEKVKQTAQAKGTVINNDSKLEKQADDFGITYANSLQNNTPSTVQNKFESGFSLDNPIQNKLPKNIENSTSLPNFQLSPDLVQKKEEKVKPTAQAKGIAINNDSKLEKEADDFGTAYANSLQNNTPSTVQNKFESGFSLDNPIQNKLPKNIKNSTSLPNFQLSSDLVQKKEEKVKPTAQAKGIAINNDSKLEKEADDFGTAYANSLQNNTPSTAQNKFESGFSLDNTIQNKLPKNLENSTSLPNFQLSSELVQKKEEEGDSHPEVDMGELRAVQYELVAHGLAYTTIFNHEQNNLLQSWGFMPDWYGGPIDHNTETGFFAGLLMPNLYSDDTDLGDPLMNDLYRNNHPILAFRGSETSADPDVSFQWDQFFRDWLYNDMDPTAVGYTAFMMHQNEIRAKLEEAISLTGKKVVVTGHSLGGSLAKQAALQFPQFIHACYTYQAPGISEDQQAYLEQNGNTQTNAAGEELSTEDREFLEQNLQNPEEANDVMRDIYFESHTSEGDIVHHAGGGRVPGANRLQHDPSDPIEGLTPLAHTLRLTNSEQYNEEHAIFNRMLEAQTGQPSDGESTLYEYSTGELGDTQESVEMSQDAYQTDSEAHRVAETLRDSLIAEMFNPHAQLIMQYPQYLQQMPISAKIQIMSTLLNGPGLLEAVGGGAAIGMGIRTAITNPGLVLGTVGGGFAAFSEFGDEAAVPGAVAGGVVGSHLLGPLSLVLSPVTSPLGSAIGTAAGLTYSIFAISNDMNTTQKAVMMLLRHSTPEQQVQMIGSLGGAIVFYERMDTVLNGLINSNFQELRTILIQNGGYFQSLSLDEGSSIVSTNLNSGIAWMGDDTEERLIADVLLFNANGRAIITQIGDGDYNEGLRTILSKLQGAEDNEVTNEFPFEGSFLNRYKFW